MRDDRYLELSEDDFNLLESLPLCGCGIPQVVYALYHDVLSQTPKGGVACERWPTWAEQVAPCGGNETLFYVVAYVLDHIEATEHGGNVTGAWRTEKGERLLAILNRFAELDYDAIPTYVPA